MSRATMSLPTPLSPVIRIFASERAAHSISCSISHSALLAPTSLMFVDTDTPSCRAWVKYAPLRTQEEVISQSGGVRQPLLSHSSDFTVPQISIDEQFTMYQFGTQI